MTQHKVKFVDLGRQYLALKPEIDMAIKRVVDESAFILGKEVSDFETNFKNTIGSRYCISCGNGTDALILALKALNLSHNDEVVIPCNTWISTAEAVSWLGGKPVFCDVKEDTFNIAPEKIEKCLNEKTVGIIAVHLYGMPAEMEAIKKIAQQNKLWVIEDCAQAHLAKISDKNVGMFGNISTFSFFPTKNLGAFGDGGAVLTDDTELAVKIRKLARHGGLNKNEHEIIGVNSRLDSLQAAILNVKLQALPDWNEQRATIAKFYIEELSGLQQVKLPVLPDQIKHSWHLFVIRTKKRDQLKKYLEKVGVNCQIHYPKILPNTPVYSDKNSTECAVGTQLEREILSLPIFPLMLDEEKRLVVDGVREFFA